MKRREFLVGTAGALGGAIPTLGMGQIRPCPPGSVQVQGGTTATTNCPPYVPPAVGTPAWLQNRAINEWFQIPGTNLSSVPPNPVPGGITGPSSKIVAWCGATLKRSGSTYLIGAAGGHGDYYGNEVNAITLGANTPAWTQLRASSPDSTVINEAPVNLDYRRSSTHTYYGTQFVEQDNRLVISPASGPGASSLPNNPSFMNSYPPDRLFCSFSLDDNDWDAASVQASGRGVYANWPGSGDFTAALCCSDPSTGNIYYARSGGGGQLWRWSRTSNAWSALAAINHTNYAGSAVDFTRGRMLIVGDYSGTVAPRVYRIDNGSSVAATFGGLGPNVLKTGGYPGVVYDEANDRFLVFKNSNPISVFAVSASTWAVELLPTSGTPPAARQNGVLNSIQYAPELKGVVMALTYTGNMYFMRLG